MHSAALQPAFSRHPFSVRRRVKAGRSGLVVQARVGLDISKASLLEGLQFIDPRWSTVENETQFFSVLEGEIAAKRCPPQLLPLWKDFYNNYHKAITGSGVPGADARMAAKLQSTIADTVLGQFRNSYTFPPHHLSLVEPYDYYEFGQRYGGSLIDFQNSVLGHPERWAVIADQLKQKHNVLFLANHQTEADPAVFAHMLESSHPELAKNVTYVAGDRVISDPLCKPFSMGRNLFCVHSKKYMDAQPELKAAKMAMNSKTIINMARKLNEGGVLLWIAPSGGRDRPKADGKWSPDPFDPSAVELMRNLVARAKQPGHLYPMAMFSYPLMPPPVQVVKELGERRVVNFTGVGISVCEELQLDKLLDGVENAEERQRLLAQKACEAVSEEYALLEAAIKDPELRKRRAVYVQPWRTPATAAV